MKILLATIQAAMAEAVANRKSFAFQVAAMAANDIIWVIFWHLFFAKVGSIRGWNLDSVLLLFAMITTVVGLATGFMSNAKRLGSSIADGELDSVLTLPVDPLGYMLVRRVSTFALGDFVFGICLFVLAGHPTLQRTITFAIVVLLGATVLVSFLVLLSSLTLFMGGRGNQSYMGFQAITFLGSYPLSLFGGTTKALLFTVVPVGFVTGLPTELVESFSLSHGLALFCAALGSAVGARVAFSAGLRRYRSGSMWVSA